MIVLIIPLLSSGLPWKTQWQTKVPGVLNVTLFVSPGCKFLVLNDLSIAVAECAVVPAFIQVTVVPTFTFISFGVNSNSFIVTEGPPGAGACATAMWPLLWRSRVTTHTNNPRNLAGCKMCLLSSDGKCGKIAWKNLCSSVC